MNNSNKNHLKTPSQLADTLACIDKIGRAYSVDFWTSRNHRRDYAHDLTLMLQNDDLERIVIRLLDRDGNVVFELPRWFKRHDSSCPGLPLLHDGLIHDGELVLTRKGFHSHYQDELRLSWGSAEPHQSKINRSYVSAHLSNEALGAAVINVTSQAERRLEVNRAGTQDFAFARDLDTGLDGIYLKSTDAPTGHRFVVGQRLAGIVHTTPRGLQGHCLRILEAH